MVMLVGFGVLALIAAIVLLRPMLRDPAERSIAGVMVLLLVGASIGLYVRWSNGHAVDIDTVADESSLPKIGQLARQLERRPDNIDGWLELGREHLAVGQFPLAQRAFRRADRLAEGKSADALMGVAESMVLQADGEVDARAGRLFEMALALAPQSEKALFFSAIAAQNRGENALAIERYQGMLALAPPAEIERILQQQIAALGGSVAAPSAPRIELELQLATGMSSRLTSESTLFVFVRKPGQGGPPLAAKRLSPSFPQVVTLTPADSMVPGVQFAAGEEVEVSAKISATGSATPAADDLIGTLRYRVGRDSRRILTISGPAS